MFNESYNLISYPFVKNFYLISKSTSKSYHTGYILTNFYLKGCNRVATKPTNPPTQTLGATPHVCAIPHKHWVQGLDLNQGPSGYEPDELPDCSTLQQITTYITNMSFEMSSVFRKNWDKLGFAIKF